MASTSFYNQEVFIEQQGNSLVVSTGGTFTMQGAETVSGTLTVSGSQSVTGTLTIGAAGKYLEPTEFKTTASTGTVLSPCGLSVLKSTKTAKVFTLAAPTAGQQKKLVCISASATGFIHVKLPATAKYDEANWTWKFKKGTAAAPTIVHFMAVNSTRVVETYRSVADGTSITSTST